VLVCLSNAVAEAGYRVTDLGILQNGGFGCTMAVNNHGVGFTQYGVLNASGQLVKGRAAINVDGLKFDLGTLGGPNSWMNGFAGINERGEAVGLAERMFRTRTAKTFAASAHTLRVARFVGKTAT
jgi:hypothetical protein